MLRAISIVALLGALGLAALAAGAEQPGRQQVLAGWFAVLLGAGLVLRGAVRMQDGEVRLSGRTVRRAERPRSFAFGVALLLVPGVAMMVAGAYWLVS